MYSQYPSIKVPGASIKLAEYVLIGLISRLRSFSRKTLVDETSNGPQSFYTQGFFIVARTIKIVQRLWSECTRYMRVPRRCSLNKFFSPHQCGKRSLLLRSDCVQTAEQLNDPKPSFLGLWELYFDVQINIRCITTPNKPVGVV